MRVRVEPPAYHWLRVLRCARLGLTLGGLGRTGRGPGSDWQLGRKVAQCWIEIARSRDGDGAEIEDFGMDAEPNDNAQCEYPTCIANAKGDGLCFKHHVMARRGDEIALGIIARRNSGRKPVAGSQEETPHGVTTNPATGHGLPTTVFLTNAGHGAADGGEKEQRMASVKCEKCGRTFDQQGIGPHRKSCDGTVPLSGPACGVNGCTRVKGHKGNHWHRLTDPLPADPAEPSRVPDHGQAARPGGPLEVQRLADMGPGPAPAEPGPVSVIGVGLREACRLLELPIIILDVPDGLACIRLDTGRSVIIKPDGRVVPGEIREATPPA